MNGVPEAKKMNTGRNCIDGMFRELAKDTGEGEWLDED